MRRVSERYAGYQRLAGPTFDTSTTSTALEMLGFTGPDAREGVRALKEKRDPSFDDGAAF